MEAMEALRSTSQQGKTGNPGVPAAHTQAGGQGFAALLVMLAVLCFICAYCCWGAPCCRAFCRRRCCRLHAPHMDSSPSDIGLSGMGATPTIILLPYGRMLVVDGTVFAQLQADTTGLDLIELGENVIRAQRGQQQQQQPARSLASFTTGSVPSILDADSETASKDGYLSPLTGLPPPTYKEIFGSAYIEDMPPTYDDVLVTVTEGDCTREPCYQYTVTNERLTPVERRREEGEQVVGDIRESQV